MSQSSRRRCSYSRNRNKRHLTTIWRIEMNSGNTTLRRYALLLTVICLSGLSVFAQEKARHYSKGDFCDNNNFSNGRKVSFKELRETTIPSPSLLNVDARRNGGVRIKGSDRSDVLVRACIQGSAESEEAAQAVTKNIRIETGSVVRAEGTNDEENWAVSYEIHVPRQTNLKLQAQNGGIGISGVDGSMDFETQNGGIHLSQVGGNVKGRTTNGGLHVVLSGSGWRGSGLDVETTNGGVHLSMPQSYAARIETGTVNGGFRSDIPALNIDRKDRTRSVRINTDLNGGGAPLRLITVNGGVHINSN